MIIGIEGFLGDGKTIYMVRCLKQDSSKGRKVYTNLKLNNIEYEHFNVEEFLNNEKNDNLTNATIGIDEITVFMDCRRSGKRDNVLLSYLILQSRKRNLDLYFTCQSLSFIDLRLLQFTSIIVSCQRSFYEDNRNKRVVEIPDMRHYTIIDLRQRKENIVEFDMDISKYYNYYDTNQIIEPIFRNKIKYEKNKTVK